MSVRNERTVQMMDRFMELHNQGFMIPEIAEMFSLHQSTVYRNLKEIAELNGTTREVLLQVVRTPISREYWEKDRKQAKQSFGALKNGFQTLEETINVMRTTIKEEFEDDNYDY